MKVQATQQISDRIYGTRYTVSVESADGKEQHVFSVFDTTINMAKHIENIFESLNINPKYKKYSVIKIKRN